MVEISNAENHSTLAGWHLGIGLFLSANLVVFLGLKLPWFRSRMIVGRTKKEKRETVQVLGFKSFSEFPTYTSTSEFAPTKRHERPNSLNLERRTPNPEVASRVHNMMNKSTTDLRAENTNDRRDETEQDERPASRNDHAEEPNGRSRDEIGHVRCDDGDACEPVPKQPKSILKKPTDHAEDSPIENGFNLLLIDFQPDEPDDFETLPSSSGPERHPAMEDSTFPNAGSACDDSHSFRSDTPPTINYNTLPKSSFKPSISYIYDLSEKYGDDFREVDLNEPETTTEFKKKTLAEEMYNDEFQPYVIEVNEGDDDREPVDRQRSVHFRPAHDDEGELYDDVMEALAQRKNSGDSYDSDYASAERTSYFRTGNGRYSSQAADVFFGGRKPQPPPRRQTARFETTC